MTTNTMIAKNMIDFSMSYLGEHYTPHHGVIRYGGIIVSNENRIPAQIVMIAGSLEQRIEVEALHKNHLAADEELKTETDESDRLIVSGRNLVTFDCSKLVMRRDKEQDSEEFGPWESNISGAGTQFGDIYHLPQMGSQLATLTALHDFIVAVVDKWHMGWGFVSGLALMDRKLAGQRDRRDYDAKTRGKALSAVMDLARAEISIKMTEAGLSMVEISNDIGLTPREQAALYGQIVDCASPQMPFSAKGFYRHLTGHGTFDAAQKRLEKKIDAAGQRLHDVRNTGCLLGDRLTERLEQLCIEMAHGDALYEDHQRDIYEEAETDHHDNAKAEVEAEMAA